MSKVMMPNHLNNHGNVFGGEILAHVDLCAGTAAMKHAGKPCVTRSIDNVSFDSAVYAGEMLTAVAEVVFVGKTSMEVQVEVYAENVLQRTNRHTNTCVLTFVALDPEGKPTPVPPLRLETPQEEARYRAGLRRREQRIRDANQG